MKCIDEVAFQRLVAASSPWVVLLVAGVFLTSIALSLLNELGLPNFRSGRLRHVYDVACTWATGGVCMGSLIYFMFVIFMWGNGRLNI
jgi:hypothetical protein